MSKERNDRWREITKSHSSYKRGSWKRKTDTQTIQKKNLNLKKMRERRIFQFPYNDKSEEQRVRKNDLSPNKIKRKWLPTPNRLTLRRKKLIKPLDWHQLNIQPNQRLFRMTKILNWIFKIISHQSQIRILRPTSLTTWNTTDCGELAIVDQVWPHSKTFKDLT